MSGYTYCKCRDCFEIVVSNCMAHPDMCDECQEAGCEPNKECCSEHSYCGDDYAH